MFDSYLKSIDRSSRSYRWFMCIVDGLVICLGIAAAVNMATSAKDLGFEVPLSWTNLHRVLLDDFWFWANSLAALSVAA